MARNDEEVQDWRQRGDQAVFESFVFLVLHYQDFIRYLLFRQENELGEVWSGALHILDFVEVRAHFLRARWTNRLTALVGFLRSDRYSRNDCTSNWKAMLLNKVVVGKGYKMTVDNTTLTKPPAGYDSVSDTT